MQHACKVLVGKPEGKRSGERPRRRWEDNIRTDLMEVRWEGVDWMNLAQDYEPVAGTCEHANQPSGFIHGEESLD
jgi:hypothetical protein